MKRALQVMRSDEGGASPLEMVIMAPFLILIIGVLIYGGRTRAADNSVEQAATDAARSASTARSSSQAQEAARTAALASLQRQGLKCSETTASIDTSGFRKPAGTPANVTATVTCVVSMADVSIPGIPGSKTVTASWVSPLDIYRART